MREEITMISSDENRKVIISKYTYDGCSIKMYSNGFCQMELLTYEDLFQLSKKQLRIRHCIQLVNRFLEEGIEDLSFDDIDELLKANREYMNCFIEMLFENTLEIAKGFGGIEFSTASIDVLGKALINTSHKYEKVPYKELAKLSTAEAFYKFSGWDMYDFVNSSLSYRRKNEEAESAFDYAMDYVEVDGISLYMYHDVLNILKSNEYLRKVDFFSSGKVLKLDNIQVNMKLELASTQSLEKKIVLIIFMRIAHLSFWCCNCSYFESSCCGCLLLYCG